MLDVFVLFLNFLVNFIGFGGEFGELGLKLDSLVVLIDYSLKYCRILIFDDVL